MSLYQLAFGLNAVIHVLNGNFRSVRAHVVDEVERQVAVYFPDFFIRRSNKYLLSLVAVGDLKNIALIDKFHPVLVFCSVFCLSFSAFLMTVSATNPALVVENIYLYIYVIIFIFVMPSIYMLWGRYLNIVERASSRLVFDKNSAEMCRDHFNVEGNGP